MMVALLSLTALNASAFQWHGNYGGYHGGYRGGYHGGYGYHGGHGYGWVPWVVGGAFLYGAIQLSQSQTVYVDNGVPMQRIDTYCTDQYGNYVYDQSGRRVICGYQWVPQQ